MKRTTLLLFLGMLSGTALAANQTQSFSTSANTVRINPIYHATVQITEGGNTIYIDPAKPAKIAGLVPADLILITDVHFDHMDPEYVASLSKANTLIIAPAAVAKTITQAKVLANGESTRWRGWKITAVPMYNVVHNQPSGQPWHDKGRGNGYVLSYGQKTFYVAGDTEGTPEMRALKDIDVAIIPMRMPYTMTPAEAADAVKAFRPKIVLPYHYKGEDVAVFSRALEGTDIQVRSLNWYPE